MRQALFLLLLCAALFPADLIYPAFPASAGYSRLTHFTGPLPVFCYGPSSASGNPALLAGHYGHEAFVTMSDLAEPMALGLSYCGRFLDKAAMGLSVFHVSREGYVENVTAFSTALSGPGVDFGVTLKAMSADGLPGNAYSSSLFALDADAGIMADYEGRVYGGAAITNIVCPKPVDNYDITIRPERGLKLSLGVVPDRARRVVFFAEGGLDSLHGAELVRYYGGSGAEGTFFETRWLAVRAAYLMASPSKGTRIGYGHFGLGLVFPMKKQRLRIDYSLRKAFSDDPSAESDRLVHYAGAGMSLGGKTDYIAPNAEAGADRDSLSPDGDGVDDRLTFTVLAEDDPGGRGIEKWALIIYVREAGNKLHPVKSFSGSGVPPRAIGWDGRNAQKEILGKGVYYYQLRVTDFDHNYTDSPLKAIRIIP